jgi:hypothetical protein
LPRELDTKCNCYIATIIALFIAFSLELEDSGLDDDHGLFDPPAAFRRAARESRLSRCTFIGGAAMIATDGRRRS